VDVINQSINLHHGTHAAAAAAAYDVTFAMVLT